MSKDELDSEWLEALEVEDAPEDDAPVENEEVKDEEVKDESDDGSADDDEKSDEDDSGDEPSEEPEDKEADKPADDKPPETPAEEEKPDVKQAIKEALQEIEASKTDRSTKFDNYKTDVSKSLYPEGIDRQLRDSDGDPITGIEDLTKLINPKTGDLFTDEEAGSYLLSAQQKLNRDVESVEKFIEEVAETNVQIEDGALRVVEKYGSILEKNTELRDRLLAGYNKTLVKDPNTGVAIKAPIDVVEFFDLALEPMIKQQSAEAEAAAKASKEAEARAQKQAQSDRGDLKPSGKAEQLAPEDEEWAEAEKAYQKGEIR